MTKTKIGLMVVASRFESGGERAEELARRAQEILIKEGYEVLAATKTVWDPADALTETTRIAKEEPDLLLVIHASWVLDSLQYILVNTAKCPLVLWAVPYTETFSFACVQHFSSILRQHDLICNHLYGLPDDRNLLAELAVYAAAARAYQAVRRARIALLGPRQTWRVASSQDMTSEEWDFSKTFGTTIVHIEMEELLSVAKAQTEESAAIALAEMRSSGRLIKPLADDERLLQAARVYLGIKQLSIRYGLNAVAAECYPNYIGLTNIPASWLADEGFVLETEGDIGHTTLRLALNEMAPGVTALAEASSYDITQDSVYLAHGGSSAHSLADDFSRVHIPPNGNFVGLPFKPMPIVTLASLCGLAGTYRMTIATGAIESASQKEWDDAGNRFVAKFRPVGGALAFVKRMLAAGTDHHVLIREGDLTPQLDVFCDLFGLDKMLL